MPLELYNQWGFMPAQRSLPFLPVQLMVRYKTISQRDNDLSNYVYYYKTIFIYIYIYILKQNLDSKTSNFNIGEGQTCD